MSSIAEQVGRVVGGRYRLLAAVGAGASAQVFAADDTRLGRRVAVKLLHPALAGDATFLRRFQAEARLAASLNHRNVLHVYDWGDDDGVPFLVLEYLGGGSLRSMLDDGERLSPGQAAALGAQAAQGLAYAHRRGLVHRDIKPANLLFDDEGRLLVADFGLARALAEAAMTEPLGGVLGTARYASPEQVEGRAVDDRTDVYSLALVLYEAVTGRVPFSGDTTVATLMARVGATLPPARELGPLAPVLVQAAISEPLARLDAGGLATELELLVQEIGAGDPLPLAHIDLTLPAKASVKDRDPTDLAGGAAAASRSPEQPWPVAGSPWSPLPPPEAATAPTEAERQLPPGVRRVTQPSTIVGGPGGPGARPKKRRAWRWVALAVALVLLAGAAVGGVLRYGIYGHVVPKVAGLTVAAAADATHRAGLKLVVASHHSSLTVARGAVISQQPTPGSLEKSGTRVDVVVSTGLPSVSIPNLTGLDEAQAETKLKAAYLNPSFTSAYDETVAPGLVVSRTPTGPTAPWGTKLVVVISKGPAPRTIPSNWVGQPVDTVVAAIVKMGLVPYKKAVYSTAYAAGDVTQTTPIGGQQIAKGRTVVVYYSLGPPYVSVPSLYAVSVSSAEAQLKAEGLRFQVFGPASAAIVYTTDPLPGTRVQVGAIVTIYAI